MINTDKLNEELAKASAAKATAELDRMIKLHSDEAAKQEETIKRYLLGFATTPGKAADYSTATSTASELIKHEQVRDRLIKLKESLL